MATRVRLTAWERRVVSRAAGGPRTSNGLVTYARMASAYDGDSVSAVFRHPGEKCHTVKLRVHGIDTPELRPNRNTPHRDLHAQAGAAARDRLLELAPVGSIVVLECFGEDKYGRTLADILVHPGRTSSVFDRIFRRKRISVGQQLIREGYALDYDGGTKAEFTEDFLRRIVAKAGGAKTSTV